MQKILYIITQSELGGAQRYCLDLAKNLGENFEVFFAFGGKTEDGGLVKELKKENIKYFLIKNLKRNISPLNDIIAVWQMLKIIKKINPDIIHLNSSKISILGALAGKMANKFLKQEIKIIYTAHGWVFNEPGSKIKKKIFEHLERITAKWKNKIICVSEFDYLMAIKKNIADIDKLKTINNGIEEIKFISKTEARNILKINHDNFIVGTIGNFYKTKGFEYLLEAGKILDKDWGVKLKIIIIGEGAERKNLENIILKNKIEDTILLAGAIENAATLLSAFDMYVSSSVKEGFPYSILEAMSAGLPIIATRVGGIPEMINNMENGIIIESRQSHIMAEKIKYLRYNKELRINLGIKARETVIKEFSLSKMTEETKNIYLQ